MNVRPGAGGNTLPRKGVRGVGDPMRFGATSAAARATVTTCRGMLSCMKTDLGHSMVSTHIVSSIEGKGCAFRNSGKDDGKLVSSRAGDRNCVACRSAIGPTSDGGSKVPSS